MFLNTTCEQTSMTDSTQSSEPRKHVFLDGVEFLSALVSGNTHVVFSLPLRQPLVGRASWHKRLHPSPPLILEFCDGAVKFEGVWFPSIRPSHVRHLRGLVGGGRFSDNSEMCGETNSVGYIEVRNQRTVNIWRGATAVVAGLWVASPPPPPRTVFSVSLYERILFKTIFITHKASRTLPPHTNIQQYLLSLGIRFFLSASGGP